MQRTLMKGFWCFCALLLLQGCGFRLSGDQSLPPGMDKVFVVDAEAQSPLQRALKKRLKLYQIPVVSAVDVSASDSSTVGIYLQPDSLERRLLSLFQTGQVAEYQLVLSISYQIQFPGREPRLVQFDVTREYQDDPDEILAKSRELEFVLAELRNQAADRIIRLMAYQANTFS